MSRKLSHGAENLLQVIERAPGHTRNELMTLAGISRREWSKLSGELKSAKIIRTESAKLKGKVVYRWYKSVPVAHKPPKKSKKKSKKASAVVRKHIRRGQRTPQSSWSVTEQRFLKKLYGEGMRDEQIAEAFAKDDHCANRTASSISKKRSDLGLVFGKGRKPKPKKGKKSKPKQTTPVVKKPESKPAKEITRSNKEPLIAEMEAVSLIVKGIEMLGVGSPRAHAHHEYATVRDVQESFDKVASALDELNSRLTVLEEQLAGMHTAQSEVDNKQNSALRDMLQRMSNFTTEMEDRLNNN
tara:strand:+ start:1437 stop:2333 length:897 start_codon:yes stop_codon:yes gene_type:complete